MSHFPQRIDFYSNFPTGAIFKLAPLKTFICRTKWKRQTAVGLELLAEAGNYAALQRIYSSGPAPASFSPWAASFDAAARQAAAAAIPKPMPYRYEQPWYVHTQINRECPAM